MKAHKTLTACAGAVLMIATPALAFNYGEALQKSIYFYEEQQSGPHPAWSRVEWRGDAAMNDGADQKVDLTGGWFDAGDHVKFGLPMAASATMLAWGVIDYPGAYERTGQMKHIQNNLRFVADYLVKAHTAPDELWGQVGAGSSDHAWWGPAEVMQMARPAAKIDPSCPGSDLAGETAAALASISMVFAQSDADYAAKLLAHAKQLYDFAYKYQGKYSDCITDAKSFYNSWSGYKDELVWAPLWLYRATGDKAYLERAVAGYGDLNTEQQSSVKSYHWTQSWDDKSYGSYVLLAGLTGDPKYQADAERWLDYWTVGYEGNRIRYTPGGLAFLDSWAATRYAADTAFVALVYADQLGTRQQKLDKAKVYYDFAVSQIEYILGKNPQKISYIIGYGPRYPENPHHRTAHGSWSDSIQTPTQSRHLLIGALVGGPNAEDNFQDDRSNYVYSEVATDYNAALTSALARLYLDFGGKPIPDDQFPPRENRDAEFTIEAKVNSQGPRHIEIAATVNDHTAWPARVSTDLHFRYFVNLTKVLKAGYRVEDVQLTTAYSQASTVKGLLPWGNAADHIYYLDVSFAGIKVYPGGQSASRREVQFRLELPSNSDRPEWSNDDAPSWDAYTNSAKLAPKIPLYEGDKLVWGKEPQPSCGKDSGIPCPPHADDLKLTTRVNQSVAFTPSGAETDGTIAGFKLARLPQHGEINTAELPWIYTPAQDFAGEDSALYVAVDDKGTASAAATIAISVANPGQPAVTITAPADQSHIGAGSLFTVTYLLKNVPAARLLIAGQKAVDVTASGSTALRAPDTTGDVPLSLTALDDKGEETQVTSTVTLHIDEIPAGAVRCELGSTDVWDSGFVLNNIKVTNASPAGVQGWRVTLNFHAPTKITNIWNASFTASADQTSVTAANLSNNGALAPGQSATFGLQGTHEGPFQPPECVVTP